MNKLYIGNLSWDVTSEELRSYFSQAGEVISATIILNRDTGRSRGFGFVVMATEEGKEAVLAFQDKYFNGRPLVIREALPERQGTVDYIHNVNNFLHNNPQLGDSMEFSVNDKHFTITRDR